MLSEFVLGIVGLGLIAKIVCKPKQLVEECDFDPETEEEENITIGSSSNTNACCSSGSEEEEEEENVTISSSSNTNACCSSGMAILINSVLLYILTSSVVNRYSQESWCVC